MAVLKERLNRKNTLGGYDTIHLETSSDLVKRSDGTTVEAAITTITTNITNVTKQVENVQNNVTTVIQETIQQGNAKHASSHGSSGTDPITPASIGALAANGTAAAATKLATSRTFQVNLASTSTAGFTGEANCTPGVTGTLGLGNGGTGKTTAPLANYALINGSTAITSTDLVDSDIIPVGDVSAATGKKITVAELKKVFTSVVIQSGVAEIPRQPGATVNWGGYNWTVVHVASGLIYMILTTIYSLTQFGSNTTYAGSTIANLCTTFLNTMDAGYRNVLADVTVNGVTNKVFVPAHGMVCNNSTTDGTSKYPCFSWFNAAYNTSYANRVAYYNGSAQWWWTSTANSSSSVWRVATSGGTGGNGPSGSYGFRPCVAVKYT